MCLRSLLAKYNYLQNKRNSHDQYTAYQIKPEERQDVDPPNIDDEGLGNQCRHKGRVAADEFDKEGQKKDSQYIPVKDGTYDIDQLNQVVKQIGHTGYQNGQDTPK